MANKEGHRRFGSVRRREWAGTRSATPDQTADAHGPETYERKSDADKRWF